MNTNQETLENEVILNETYKTLSAQYYKVTWVELPETPHHGVFKYFRKSVEDLERDNLQVSQIYYNAPSFNVFLRGILGLGKESNVSSGRLIGISYQEDTSLPLNTMIFCGSVRPEY